MKYFIDFEASDQQSIISVGCVRSDGRQFYSLVYTEDEISSFITKLTGISQEMLDEADDLDAVFENLYDWCNQDEEMPQFYCYGDSDLHFVSVAFNQANSFKAGCMLGYLYTNLADYSEDVKEHFCVSKSISLEKVSNYFANEEIAQNHNALDDALRLKLVYENVEGKPKEVNVFNEYLETFTKRNVGNIKQVLRMRDGEVLEVYSSLKEAANWVASQPNDRDSKYIKDAEEKIRKAANDNIKYFKYNWRIL